jgi:histone H3/H4
VFDVLIGLSTVVEAGNDFFVKIDKLKQLFFGKKYIRTMPAIRLSNATTPKPQSQNGGGKLAGMNPKNRKGLVNPAFSKSVGNAKNTGKNITIGKNVVPKKRKINRRRSTIKDIKYHQRNSAQLLFRMSSMKKMFQRILNKHTDVDRDINIPLSAVIPAAYWVQNVFREMLEDANLLTLHAKRVKLGPKDIQLAKRIREGA